MTSEQIAAFVGETLATATRRAAVPAFMKIAHRDDVVVVEAVDGSFFEIRVTDVDDVIFPERTPS